MPSLVEIGSVVLEILKKIFFYILSMYFHCFVIISPWKRAGPSFEQTLPLPFTQGFFVPNWLKLAQWVLEKMKIVKTL